MAVRLTKGGLQSYDPLQKFKKKTTQEAPPAPPAPKPSEKEAQKSASVYLKQREKLKGLGYTEAQANMMISQQYEANLGPEEKAYREKYAPEKVAKEAASEAKRAELAGILGQIGNVPENVPANIKAAGIMDILPEVGIKGGAAAGGAAAGTAIGAITGGTLAATGVGAIALAAGAAVVANSIVSSLKEERIQQVKVERKTYLDSITNLKAIILEAKTGDALQAVEMYNNEINLIWQAESNLKLLDESMWAKSKDELVGIETFRRNMWRYNLMLENALIQNPNAVYDFPEITEVGIEE